MARNVGLIGRGLVDARHCGRMGRQAPGPAEHAHLDRLGIHPREQLGGLAHDDLQPVAARGGVVTNSPLVFAGDGTQRGHGARNTFSDLRVPGECLDFLIAAS